MKRTGNANKQVSCVNEVVVFGKAYLDRGGEVESGEPVLAEPVNLHRKDYFSHIWAIRQGAGRGLKSARSNEKKIRTSTLINSLPNPVSQVLPLQWPE